MITRIHEEIIGRPHETNLEGLPNLNLDYERQWPYPWGTKCPETVGRVLLAYGFLIKSLKLPPGARILEVGCGMGSLTWNLARMGYRVDALDPNETQCASVRQFTSDFPCRPNVAALPLDRWLKTKGENYKYDAVIFFESFHHVMNHRECLQLLADKHLEEDGRVFLAAEPVFEHECEILPYPWGPRLDGESIRAMRNWGWLELGFCKDYLSSMFDKLDFNIEWLRSDVSYPHTHVLRATRRSSRPYDPERDVRYSASLYEKIDLSVAGLPEFIESCSGLSIREPFGRWSIGEEVALVLNRRVTGSVTIELDLYAVFGPNVHKTLTVTCGEATERVKLYPAAVQSSYLCRFPRSDFKTILIRVPHPCRPKDIPDLENEDSRPVGIALRSIKISRLD
jgi:SAM-dependent methyltransferase